MSEKKAYLIIRIRGEADAPPYVRKTLENLRLHKRFHAVVYPADLPGIEGMLRRAQAWITWGEVDKETLAELLRVRGRAPGDKPLTSEYIKEKFGVESFEELAEKIINGEVKLHKQEHIKPVFRLHPPRGGFRRSVKRPYGSFGEAGYRGSKINELVNRMF